MMASVDPAQYEAFTKKCGFALISSCGLVEITGDDRIEFLHNMCTNDVRRLPEGQGGEAFFTNAQGKILGFGALWRAPERMWLMTFPNQNEALLPHLTRYRIMEKVQFNDQSDAMRLLAIAGAESPGLLGGALDGGAPETLGQLRRATLVGCEVLAYRIDWFGEPSFLLAAQSADVGRLADALRDRGAIACDLAVLEAVRVENGFPLYGTDITEAHLPQEVARDARAISFTKGCYIGQETVARIDALGHVNRLLSGVRGAAGTQLSPGDALLQGDKKVGEITSVVQSPKLDAPLAMAYLRREASQPGTTLDVAPKPSSSGRGQGDGDSVEVVLFPVS